MNKMYKIMFTTFMISGSLISISSYSWMGMWLGLEINLLSIIPLLTNLSNKMASESALKYFIIQAMASSMLMLAILLLMTNMFLINNLMINKIPPIILNSALLTKMGAAPFHFWFPEVMEGLNWMNCFIMLTWQKLTPMVLVMYNVKMIYFLSIIIIISMMIGGIMGINQTSLRKILTYSSINHIGWMIGSMMFIETIWMYYFITYSMISLNIILMFKNLNISYLKQLFVFMNNNSMMKSMFIFNFMSLGGLPPFLGFFPKWLTIQTLVNNHMLMLSLIMVILTLITLFFYIRITFSSLIMTINEPKWLNMLKTQNMFFTMMFNIMMIMGLMMCTALFNWM